MKQIHAYLNFNGRCREAMSFYKDCLGGELILQPIKGTPFEARCPAGTEHHIMHSALKGENFLIMASDMTPPEGIHSGNNFSLSLNCSSEDELRSSFDKLLEGGSVIEPIKVQFWGAVFGCLTDKFGIRWMFNYEISKPGQTAGKTIEQQTQLN